MIDLRFSHPYVEGKARFLTHESISNWILFFNHKNGSRDQPIIKLLP